MTDCTFSFQLTSACDGKDIFQRVMFPQSRSGAILNSHMRKNNIIKAYGILLCRVLYSGTRKLLDDNSKIQFLFLKASYGKKHWTPPKGLHENNEDGLDTALRETLEETGLDKDKYKLLNYQKTLKYMVDDSLKETTYYLALLLNNEECITLSDEHTDYKWIHSDESVTYSLPESLTDLLINAEDFLKNNGEMIMS